MELPYVLTYKAVLLYKNYFFKLWLTKELCDENSNLKDYSRGKRERVIDLLG